MGMGCIGNSRLVDMESPVLRSASFDLDADNAGHSRPDCLYVFTICQITVALNWNVPVPLVLLKFTVVSAATGDGLPRLSWLCTVIVPVAAFTVVVCAAVINTNWLGALTLIVSSCVAPASTADPTVTVGVPAFVSV